MQLIEKGELYGDHRQLGEAFLRLGLIVSVFGVQPENAQPVGSEYTQPGKHHHIAGKPERQVQIGHVKIVRWEWLRAGVSMEFRARRSSAISGAAIAGC